MKIHPVHILLIATTLGVGLAYHFLHVTPRQPSSIIPGLQAHADAPKTMDPELENNAIFEPVPLQNEIASPMKVAVPAEKKPPKPAAKNEQDASRYWQHMANNFDRQMKQLSREMDPAKRMNLIRAMARYVRADTLSALDWAMSLEDPEERRAALEAINDNALVGIGAKIEIDETGFPKIRGTTVLSAVASTGLVELGDYIVGMVDGEGKTVYFEGLPAKQVAQFLRGQPGTDLTLLMERPIGEGASYPFDVPVQRSLIVMPPLF